MTIYSLISNIYLVNMNLKTLTFAWLFVPHANTDVIKLTRRTRYVFIPFVFTTFFQRFVSIPYQKKLDKRT